MRGRPRVATPAPGITPRRGRSTGGHDDERPSPPHRPGHATAFPRWRGWVRFSRREFATRPAGGARVRSATRPAGPGSSRRGPGPSPGSFGQNLVGRPRVAGRIFTMGHLDVVGCAHLHALPRMDRKVRRWVPTRTRLHRSRVRSAAGGPGGLGSFGLSIPRVRAVFPMASRLAPHPAFGRPLPGGEAEVVRDRVPGNITT